MRRAQPEFWTELTVTSEPRKSWRYSVGLTPQTSRKTCAKCCWVLKPQATATSNTRVSRSTQDRLGTLDPLAPDKLMRGLAR